MIEVRLNPTTIYRINTWSVTEFIHSDLGVKISLSTYIFRDIILLLFEAIINIFTIVCLENYIRNKNKLQNPLNQIAIANGNKRINESEQKATVMIIIMSILSTIQHIFLMTTVIVLNFYSDQAALLFGFFSNAFVSFRHVINIFLLYFLNKNFRIEFKKTFKNSINSNKKEIF
jgi:hypothetical protein